MRVGVGVNSCFRHNSNYKTSVNRININATLYKILAYRWIAFFFSFLPNSSHITAIFQAINCLNNVILLFQPKNGSVCVTGMRN